MRAVLLIAAKDLRLRVRDRSVWLTAVVAPLALAATISVALGGLGQGSHVSIAVVDADHGPVGALFVQSLQSPQLRRLITSKPVASPAVAQSLVRTGGVNAAVVVPAGFSERAGSGSADLQVLARADQLLGKGVARAVADGFLAHVAAARLAVATVASLTPEPDAQLLAAVASDAARAEAGDALADRSPGRPVAPATYYGPAMAILFLCFVAGFGARSFLAEQRDGTMARLLAAPVRPMAVLAGKAAATFVVGLASLLVMYGVSALVFHARWGDPVAVVLLCMAAVVAVMAATALITTFARTDEQANGYTGASTFVLALLGGNFIEIYRLPSVLRTVSALTPNGWALRGFSDLAAGAAGVSAVALPLAAVCAFAAVCAGLALRRSPRLVAA